MPKGHHDILRVSKSNKHAKVTKVSGYMGKIKSRPCIACLFYSNVLTYDANFTLMLSEFIAKYLNNKCKKGYHQS